MNREKLISTLQQIKTLADECLEDLGESAKEKRTTTKSPAPSSKLGSSLSFDLNPLAFMKRYGRGLGGPEKFTLLLARLSKGDASHGIARGEIEKQWNKMKGVMGGEFNPVRTHRAKASGWVDTKKHGIYVLAPDWKEIFSR